MINVIASAAIALPILLFLLWLRTRSLSKQQREQIKLQIESLSRTISTKEIELKKLRERFLPIISIEKEIASVAAEKIIIEESINKLQKSYLEKKAIFDDLLEEVAIYDEKIAFAQLGLYSPHFEFTDSDQFKAQIEEVRTEQKSMVSTKVAINAYTDWEVGGSKREGKKMTDRAIRLSLRAYNNECDAALSNVRWNNISSMEKRIKRAFEQINKLNDTLNIKISTQYHQLKLNELWLTHEYRERQKEERDHKAEMNRLKREEERLIQDAIVAEKDEAKYQKLLENAKREAERAVGIEVNKYNSRIAELTLELEAARMKVERAKSMAEQTRAGHIYVVSNVGSFGEGVYKIGMTRRLEPMDRVRELGDASVPFSFDTHAMIYSEDAPNIERSLHSVFERKRVNRANGRKEFFRVSLEEVEAEIRRIDPDADFVSEVEAQEYYETLAIIKAENQTVLEIQEKFPSEI